MVISEEERKKERKKAEKMGKNETIKTGELFLNKK